MLQITQAHIDAIRPALQAQEGIQLRVAAEYSYRERALVAVAILHGAGFEGKELAEVSYSTLLWHLILAPIMSSKRWQEDPAQACRQWHSKIDQILLTENSRKFRLHEGLGGGKKGVRLLPNAILAELVSEDPDFAGRCREWYEEALQSIAANKR